MPDPIIDLSGAPAAGYEDPTDAELEADAAAADTPAPTDLATLEAELREDLAAQPIRLNVSGRDGYVAVYRGDFTGEDVEKYRKASRRKGRRNTEDDVDGVKFAGLLLTRTIVHIERNGEVIVDSAGDPLTFSSPALQDIYDVNSAIDCARRFFGGDGRLDAQAGALIAEAGWGDEALTADPS